MKHQSFDVEFRERVERWLAAPLDSIPAGSVRLLLDSHDRLVAALREIVANVEDREGMGDFGGKPDAYLRAIRDIARAALQKAEA